jgi:hypothetical protein
MSKNIQVYPGTNKLPSYTQVLELINMRLKEFLKSIEVYTNIEVELEIRDRETDDILEFDIKNPVMLKESEYALFRVNNESSGCSAYIFNTDEREKELWEREIHINQYGKKLQERISISMNNGYHWSFRISLGEPEIIKLAHGLIAAAFAQLTEGFIFSYDFIWGYKDFPALEDDYFNRIFKPDLTNKNVKKVYCEFINSIVEVYGSPWRRYSKRYKY